MKIGIETARSAAAIGSLALGLGASAALAQTAQTDAVAPAQQIKPIAVLGAKLGYNSARGGIAGISFSANELFGRPQRLTFSGEVSRSDKRLNLSYRLPSVSDEQPNIGFGAYRNDTRASAAFGFDTLSYGVNGTWRKALSPSNSFAVSLSVSEDRLFNLGSPTSALIAADAGTRRKTGLGFDYSFSATKTQGGLSADFARSDSGASSLKTEANIAQAWTGEDAPVLITTKLAFGHLNSVSGASHIGDRFMMGQGLVRGFDYGGIGPRDMAAGGAVLGGNSYASVKLDVSFPKLIPRNDKLLMGMFVDAGSLWGLDNTAGGVGGASTVDDAQHLRSSVGVAFRYQLGVGSANLYLSKPIEKQSYDRDSTVQFSFDAKF